MKQDMPVTWSNTHQRRFNNILENAFETGQLIVEEGSFNFLPSFFNTEAGAYILETMPKSFLDAKVAVWLEHKEKLND
ncbi:hypothetical protein [Marinobacter sp.]|uniref:hypothetical protein n=1 Tax=Marinobacter sp. TaxID=50741 RepID=UPI003A911659